MTSYLNTPDFPIISVKTTYAEQAFTLTNTTTATSVGLTIPAGTYWGYAPTWDTGPTVPVSSQSSTTLLGALAAAVQTSLRTTFGDATAVCWVELEWTTSGGQTWLQPTIRIEIAGSDTYTITLPSNTQDFGYITANRILSSPNYSSTGTYTPAGIWAPRNLTVLDVRDPTREVYKTQSATGLTVSTTSWGPVKTKRNLVFPVTYAAYIFGYRKELAVFADPAGLIASDPNNTLEAAMSSLAIDTEVRVYQSGATSSYKAGNYWTAYYIGDGTSSLESVIDDISGNGQLYSVTLELILDSKTGSETV